jgi:hypothetical protein
MFQLRGRNPGREIGSCPSRVRWGDGNDAGAARFKVCHAARSSRAASSGLGPGAASAMCPERARLDLNLGTLVGTNAANWRARVETLPFKFGHSPPKGSF